MIVLSKHIGNMLLRMSILVQFPKVIFLFKVKCKYCLTIGVHAPYMGAFNSEIILLTAQMYALSSFHNPWDTW